MQQRWAAERALLVTQMVELASMRAKAMHELHAATEAKIEVAKQAGLLARERLLAEHRSSAARYNGSQVQD